MASTSSKVVWVVRLLEELGLYSLCPITLNYDNMSALHIAQNPVFHERTKHLEIDCHFTRDKVMKGLLQLTHLPTSSQLVDVFTKVVLSAQFRHLLTKLGMSSLAKFERGLIKMYSVVILDSLPARLFVITNSIRNLYKRGVLPFFYPLSKMTNTLHVSFSFFSWYALAVHLL